MQLNVTGHHVDVTPSLHDYVAQKMERLERHFDHVTNVHVILSPEKKQQKAEATVHISGADVFADATQMMGSSSEAMIELLGVDKFFGDFQALADINMLVGKQEVVVVIGPSGSGKSTLLTLVGALRSAQSGSLRVLGRQLQGAGERELVAWATTSMSPRYTKAASTSVSRRCSTAASTLRESAYR